MKLNELNSNKRQALRQEIKGHHNNTRITRILQVEIKRRKARQD